MRLVINMWKYLEQTNHNMGSGNLSARTKSRKGHRYNVYVKKGLR